MRATRRPGAVPPRAALSAVHDLLHSLVLPLLLLPASSSAQGLSPLADYTREQLTDAVRSPNASSRVLIPSPSGFNLEEPFPGTRTGAVAGWSFAVDIKSDVPVTSTNLFSTLTRIAYEPPENLTGVIRNATGAFAPMDGTWYPCTHIWVSNTLKAGEDSGDVAADCSSHLSEQCRGDLRQSMADGFLSWVGREASEHCPTVGIPDSCSRAMGMLGDEENASVIEAGESFYFYLAPFRSCPESLRRSLTRNGWAKPQPTN
jgi:hypothetical protein